ncbi:MAG: BlaI/MecI/CopY family transcriptional regulator [Haloechinothrix sp.]
MRGFGELEAEIMERMWALGRPATVRDVYDDLRASRDSAYTTVMTVTGILHRKGWLRRERDGRAWRYEPSLTREEYVARSMREALDDAHDREAVFTHFIQQVSPEESRALRAVLTRLVEEEDR